MPTYASGKYLKEYILFKQKQPRVCHYIKPFARVDVFLNCCQVLACH